VVVVQGGQTLDDVVLYLGNEGGVVSGVVMDAEGNPMAEVGIMLIKTKVLRAMDTKPESAPAQGKTDEQGLFRFASVPFDNYTLWFVRGGRTKASVMGASEPFDLTPEAPTHEVEFRVSQGSLAGQVIDAQGASLSGMYVMATLEGGSEGPLAPFGGAMTDGEGRYRIEDLAVGRYGLTALRPGGASDLAPASVRGIDVVAGQTLEGVDLTLGPGRKLRGCLVGLNDAKLGLWRVCAVEASGLTLPPMMIQGIITGSTRPDGAFEIDGLAPGSYRLQFEPTSDKTLTAQFQSARFDLTDEERIFVAQIGGTLRARLLTPAATSPSDAPTTAFNGKVRVSITAAPSALPPEGSLSVLKRYEMKDAFIEVKDGALEIPMLPVGRLDVTLQPERLDKKQLPGLAMPPSRTLNLGDLVWE
jgi:hypothetical protein